MTHLYSSINSLPLSNHFPLDSVLLYNRKINSSVSFPFIEAKTAMNFFKNSIISFELVFWKTFRNISLLNRKCVPIKIARIIFFSSTLIVYKLTKGWITSYNFRPPCDIEKGWVNKFVVRSKNEANNATPPLPPILRNHAKLFNCTLSREVNIKCTATVPAFQT